MPALRRAQQLVHGMVMRFLLGVFLQGLQQGVHRQALRRGGQLGPHLSPPGLQLSDAVVGLGAPSVLGNLRLAGHGLPLKAASLGPHNNLTVPTLDVHYFRAARI